jgi:phosphopantothenoylcysteine decarboxylase/phosphopantothenate--cysteine ligase
VDAGEGRLACGDVGVGKLADVDDIAKCILDTLHMRNDYAGRRLLITAGPTREPIDPVRYISNRSSGKMGYYIAAAARDRGAEVTLVSGVVSLPDVPGVKVIRVETTQAMYDAVMDAFDDCDMVVKAAAPADYTVRRVSEFKMKTDEMLLELKPTPDILKALGERKGNKVLVGFAAETHDVSAYAMAKLESKSLDMIVANDVSVKGVGFDYDTNAVTIYKKDGGKVELPLDSKKSIANMVLDHARELF